MRYWIILAMAITAEITGTLTLKWASLNHHPGGYIFMLVMITMSYILLAFSVKKIALGIAYALWEGIGILFITLFSVTLFNESLSPLKIIGLCTLVAGIMLIKSGTTAEKKPRKAQATARGEAEHAVV